ncbi:hypothetical protein J6590_100992 [Homalodisca vitripennis]|nr:hypothetical protein J6590_100992 [Homalodisca vitripennis]
MVKVRESVRKIRALHLKVIPEEGEACSETASPVKVGRGWHTLVEGTNHTNSNSHLPQYTRPIELPMNPRISTFAVSDVPLLDIHKVAQIEVAHRFLLCPVVGSTGRYKLARSDPRWNIPEKSFKKLTSNEIDIWRCSSCRETVDATPTTPVCSSIPNLLFSSINDLESSLSENNILENLEDNGEKLQAAAKIGAALLEENNFLKEKNLRLEIKIELLEEKIFKFEAEENKYIGKIEDLLHNISETQVQLEKEKKKTSDGRTKYL